MDQTELSEGVMKLAESILRVSFPAGLPGIDKVTSDEYIERFITEELDESSTGKLTYENLVTLFEKYLEFKQLKSALRQRH